MDKNGELPLRFIYTKPQLAKFFYKIVMSMGVGLLLFDLCVSFVKPFNDFFGYIVFFVHVYS